jgi:hypothetical protein
VAKNRLDHKAPRSFFVLSCPPATCCSALASPVPTTTPHGALFSFLETCSANVPSSRDRLWFTVHLATPPLFHGARAPDTICAPMHRETSTFRSPETARRPSASAPRRRAGSCQSVPIAATRGLEHWTSDSERVLEPAIRLRRCVCAQARMLLLGP